MQVLRGLAEVEVFGDSDEVSKVTQFCGTYSISARSYSRVLFDPWSIRRCSFPGTTSECPEEG